MENQNIIEEFRHVIHIINSIVGIMILVNIWSAYYYSKLQLFSSAKKDLGVLFLCGAIFLWGTVDVVKLTMDKSDIRTAITTILSVANDSFFLFALTYFEHGIEWVTKEFARVRLFMVIISFEFLRCLVQLYLLAKGLENQADYVDISFTMLTGTILAGVLFYSFFHRKLYAIAFISIAIVMMVVGGQIVILSNCFESNIYAQAIQTASHSLLLTIFIGLAFSWIIEQTMVITQNNPALTDLRYNEEAKEIVKQYKGEKAKFKKLIKDLIIKNKTKKALFYLSVWFDENEKDEEKEKEKEKTIIFQQSIFYRLELERVRGLITKEEFHVGIQTIHGDILGILGE